MKHWILIQNPFAATNGKKFDALFAPVKTTNTTDILPI